MAKGVLDVQTLEIGRDPLVYPGVGNIGGGDAVAKPFMAAFVNDDVVEFGRDANTREILSHKTVLKPIAVGDGALVLHPDVWRLDQFVTVSLERVFAKIMLVSREHSPSLLKLLFRLLEVLRQSVKIHVEIAEPFRPVFVCADIDRYAVVVYRIAY